MWREIRTRAYGRKILAIRLAYLLLFALAAVGVHSVVSGGGDAAGGGASGATACDSLVLHLAPLIVLSLILVNALAVTSITTERDLGALDLLLVTDLAPAEFIFGKLGGIFYVAKEMILLPLLLLVYLYLVRAASAAESGLFAAGLAAQLCVRRHAGNSCGPDLRQFAARGGG